jgi:hypothetical protein
VAAQPSTARKARRWVSLGAAVLTTGGVLSIVAGPTAAGAAVSPGATTRVSVTDAGGQQAALPDSFTSGARHVVISGDGRSVAFDTDSPIDPLDNDNDVFGSEASHEDDVYVRDRAGNHTVLISRGTPPPVIGFTATAAATIKGEDGANGDSSDPSISASGRYVAFRTAASNITASNDTFPDPDPQHTEIMICDRDPDGNGVFDEHVANNPLLKIDYRYTIVSVVTTVVQNPEAEFPGPTVRTNSTSQPSLTVDEARGIGTVAWVNDVPGASTPSGIGITRFSLSATNGQLDTASLAFASPSPGRVVTGADDADSPAVSRDGTHVVYSVHYQTGPEGEQVFGRGIADAEVGNNDGFRVLEQARLDVQSVDEAGNPTFLTGYGYDPTTSGNGRLVAFEESNDNADVLLVDRDPDGNGTFGPLSASDSGPSERVTVTVVSHDNDGGRGAGFEAALTPDGRYLAFTSNESNMHNGVDDLSDTAPCRNSDFVAAAVLNCTDVVVRDLTVDAARAAQVPPLPRLKGELASPSVTNDCGAPAPTDTCEGDSFSSVPSITDDGLSVAYESDADDLVNVGPPREDSNGISDAFVRDFRPTVAGDPLNFGTVAIGSTSTQTASVHQFGFGQVLIDSVALGGPDAGDFTIVTDACTEVRLFESELCGVSILFTPTAVGARHATLTVTPRGRTPVTIDITGGVGVPPDGFTASPNPLAFGQRLALSPSGPGTVTVRNVGRLPFTVKAVTLPNGGALFGIDYKIVQNTCVNKTIPVGGSCVIRTTFTPHGAGNRNGAIQITTVQQGTTTLIPHVVGLTGRTPVPTVVVNPGVVSGGRVTTVSGTGFAPNHAVTLTIPDLGTITAQTLADGSFEQSLMVFLHAAQGGKTLTATVATTTLKATAPFLVVQGTFQAPDFIDRR